MTAKNQEQAWETEMILQMLLKCFWKFVDTQWKIMTQVLEKPPTQINSTGQRFYLLALSNILTLYWQGEDWIALKETAHVFPSYEAAKQEKPRATKQAPVGSSVVISEE